MSQDLSSILTGEPAKAAPPPTVAPVQATVYKDPIEAAVRTVWAETKPNATPEERRAIASVIANRARATGKSVGAIVQEAGQFEPWANERGRARIDGIKRDSAEYVRLMNEVGGILSGKDKPTVDHTHFYAPVAQAALAPVDGRPAKPAWDDGSGQQIGDSLFLTKPYGSNDLATLAGSSGDMTQDEAEEAFNSTFGNTGDAPKLTAGRTGFKRNPEEELSPVQDKTWQTLNRGGALDPEAPEGSLNNPFVLRKGQTEHENVGPGEFYVGLDGHLARKPGGDKDSSFTAGLGQGAADVATSMGQMLPGGQDSTALAHLEANQLQYGAQFGGDLKSGLGRFLGQAGASVPVLGGAGKVLGPGVRALGPAGEFLAGQFAKGAAPTIGNVAMRGASLAAAGAGEGAGASALVSSANDAPLGDQLAAGALTGGVLKPVGTVVGKGMAKFLGPNLSGAAPLSEQQALVARANALPHPVPLSLGDMSGGPAQQMAESALVRGSEGDIAAGVVQGFRGEQQDALRANVRAITGGMAGRDLETGAGAKAVSDKLNARFDAAKAEVDAAYKLARENDGGAHIPRDFGPVLAQGVRDAVADYEISGIPRVAKVLEALDRPIAVETVAPSETAFHGSETAGLTELKPGKRGPFGAATYLSPHEGVAQRYAGEAGSVYEAPLPGNIFNGLGSRDSSINPYQVWRDQVSKLVDAAPAEQQEELAAIAAKMQPSDGYPFFRRVSHLVGGDAEAQALFKKAGFDGVSGYVDGPEVAVFGKVPLGGRSNAASGSTPMEVRDLFATRSKLAALQASNDGVEAGAAGKAKRALDAQIDLAMKNDLLTGDPDAVKVWKEAISKRADMGRLFEGDDLIEGLTERVSRGGGSTLKVDPEDAANYILGRSALGFVGKKNLGRDLTRLRTVLGPKSDEWNALRGEVFMRVARAGEGVPEAGEAKFSGQNFQKAWNRVQREDPQVVGVLFTPEERSLMTEFAEIAQRVTTPVKGGDNPSNTAIAAKRFLGPLMQFMAPAGGAAAGGAVGGLPGAAGGAAIGTLFKGLGEILAASKARNMTYRARPRTADQIRNPLGGAALPAAGAILTDRLLGSQ